MPYREKAHSSIGAGKPRRDLNRPEAQNKTPSEGRAADVSLGSRGVLPWKILMSVLLAHGGIAAPQKEAGEGGRSRELKEKKWFSHGNLFSAWGSDCQRVEQKSYEHRDSSVLFVPCVSIAGKISTLHTLPPPRVSPQPFLPSTVASLIRRIFKVSKGIRHI